MESILNNIVLQLTIEGLIERGGQQEEVQVRGIVTTTYAARSTSPIGFQLRVGGIVEK